MFHVFTTMLAVAIFIPSSLLQVSGGSAAYGQPDRSRLEAARTAELSKRLTGKEDGRYFEASVLMNVQADEYVATFGVNEEGKSLDEARQRMDAAIGGFTQSLKQLKIAPEDVYVDFIAQNRIYGFEETAPNTLREVVVGFEVKKNVSIRYKDKAVLDQLISAASKFEIFDLVKVDYVVKDIEAVRSKLLSEASRILKRKMDEQERLLGVKVGQVTAASSPHFGIYYPVELYDSYVAQEAEDMRSYREGMVLLRARKPRTFYYNGLNAKDFDFAINPVVTEPVVQFTIYVRVRL